MPNKSTSIGEKLTAVDSPVRTSTKTSPSPKNDEEKDDFQLRLAKLPDQYREEILRQYDLPTSKATPLTILGFATWVEVLLMIAGTLFAIGAGTILL